MDERLVAFEDKMKKSLHNLEEEYAQKYGQGVIGQNVALCAYGLEFEHPSTGEHLTFGISPKNPLFS